MAVLSYKFGTKNNWRRWAWNRIKERINVPARDAVVLYLGALENLDVVEATRRGFRQENLHHIEGSKKTTDEIRRAGGLCIHGDFFDVAQSWPHNRRIDVVFGDFCNGLTRVNADSISTLPIFPPTRSAVFAFNLLRGRDSSGNELRDEWMNLRRGTSIDGVKHRALIAFSMQTSLCMELVLGGATIQNGMFVFNDDVRTKEYAEKFTAAVPSIWRHTKFEQFEYRSKSHQTFDSGVWVSPFRGANMAAWSGLDASLDASFRGCDMRRKIAAHLAHQTRRKSSFVSA